MKVKIAGLDGSLRNFGIALMTIDTETLELEVVDLIIAKTEKGKEKTVRKSSDNLERAQIIADLIREHLKGSVSVFAEVPSGGKSYDAVLGFGIVIGLYASITIPLLEVSPSETKRAAVGTRTASKPEMIDWAFAKFPKAPWRTRKLKGEIVPTQDNEHLADAVAIAHAGIRTPAFQQMLAILRAQEKAAA
jgi:Holliday junction resolvasome RuvABC endonuclease subunit